MKNLHLLPTDKPSRLIIYSILLNKFRLLDEPYDNWKHKRHIYITSDEEIKTLEYEIYYNKVLKKVGNATSYGKKIILTTDQDLINDGVQPIDDTFLDWFVKNSSCEEVETKLIEEIPSGFTFGMFGNDEPPTELVYKITIPKEEPKQETLEEAALRLYPKYSSDPYNPTEDVLEEERNIFIAGGRYQSEKMYSETEVLQLLLKLQQTDSYDNLYDWFEQFKKK